MNGNMTQVLLFLFGCLCAVGLGQTVHKMTVRSDVRFRFSTTEVTCVVTNDLDSARQFTFDVTLAKEAFITNFSMAIDGKVYPGNVKTKQKAREEYDAAIEAGHTGGLVAQKGPRHSNIFDVSVNIAAGSNVTFTLLYEELLRRRYGAYEQAVFINSEASAKAREFSIEIYIQDRREIRNVRTPSMRKDIIMNSVEEGQNSLTQITTPTATSAYVLYKPSAAELTEKGSGWFVVQYDVDSQDGGELLVVDGYFVHFFKPPDNMPPLPLDIVFVLDISGSMAGGKLDQLKDAMEVILDDMREDDRFNILLFDSRVQLWKPELQDASAANVMLAHKYVRNIHYRGSTNLHMALMRGLEMLVGSREESRVPLLFFLTDGEATTGIQDNKQIVEDVSRKNEGVVNIYSLAFGAGADYKLLRQVSARNKGFARKIYEASDASQQVSGLYRDISTIVIRDLSITYHSTSNNDDGDDNHPVVRVNNSTVTLGCIDLRQDILFGRRDVVVAGKLENADLLQTEPSLAGGLRTDISGLGAMGKINFVLEENDLTQLTLSGDNPFWNVPRDLSKMTERAWAFLRIKELLEEKVAAQENPDLVKDLDQKILELSLQYHFVTPLTSMVVTRPEDKAGNKSTEASFRPDDEVKTDRASRYRPQSSVSSARRVAYSSAALPPNTPGITGRPALPHFFAFDPPVRSGPFRSMNHRPQFLPTNMGPSRGESGPAIDPRKTHMANMPEADASVSAGSKTKRKRKNKGRKSQKKRGKKCNPSNKVLLGAIMVNGQNTQPMCIDVKVSNKPADYVVLSDPIGNLTVQMRLMKKKLMYMTITTGGNHNPSAVRVEADPTGAIVGVPAQDSRVVAAEADRWSLRYGEYTVALSVVSKRCKSMTVTVDIAVGNSDSDPAVVRGYAGLLAKTIWKQSSSRNRRSKRVKKNGKGRKRSVCFGAVPSDRIFFLGSRYAKRHRV